LTKIFPYFLKNASNETILETIQSWNEVLKELTKDQIKLALISLREDIAISDVYVSPSPERFKFKACGLIDTKMAYYYATQRKFDHPAVCYAAEKSNMFNSRFKGNEITQERLFVSAYTNACIMVLSGRGSDLVKPNGHSIADQRGDNSNKSYRSWLAKEFGSESKEVKHFDRVSSLPPGEARKLALNHTNIMDLFKS